MEEPPLKYQKLKSVIWNLIIISIGSLIFAFGAKSILIHHNFIIGGLYGTGLLVYYVTDWLSPGLLFFIGNIPIMIIGFMLMSKRFIFYSLWATIAITLASEFISYDLKIVNQLYAAVAGGLICGFGRGTILRSLGSGGGIDIIALILNSKFNIGVGRFFIFYNLCLFSLAVCFYSIDLVIASFILTYISSVTIEYVLALFNQRKIVYIISDFTRGIADTIRSDLNQGSTVIAAKGSYSGKEKPILMTITNNLQVKRLEEKVFSVDPEALFIVENSFNVIGLGFGKRKIY